MPTIDRPRLRPSITGHVDPDDPHWVWLYDQARITRQHIRIRREALAILELFDGSRELRDVQVEWMRQYGGELLPVEILRQLTDVLDQAVFLESPRLEALYESFRRSPIREPACIGSYEGDPAALRQQLTDLFHGPSGPGPIRDLLPDGSLGGALIPHIDLYRGGPTFAYGFKEVVERSDAELFIIVGTSHYSPHRFILTRKDFRTPLGVAVTDRDFVDRLADHCGPQVFEDEAAHLPEHSIEFHVLFLQYCLKERPFQIVPLLVGPFADCVASETAPDRHADIQRMIEAIRQAERASGKKVCYLCSGDLAHIGPKFGDAGSLAPPQLRHSRNQDKALLAALSAADREAFTRIIFEEGDRRRICGFAPTYLVLSVLRPASGRLLDYQQYVDSTGCESVSFASLAFDRNRGGE